ncbi:ABC transporter substrate-binding protein, partial [Vibrio parahaemolyticus]
SNSPMPRLSRYYSAMQAGATSAEPQRARSLLKAAGYNGQPITITANKRFSLMYDDAVIIQSMLQAAGINATIDVV